MKKVDIITTKHIEEEVQENLPKFFLGNSPEEAEKNYNAYGFLLKKISKSYANVTGIPEEDLFGAGLVGLARAVRDFDVEKSDNFIGYAYFRIRGALNYFCNANASIIAIPHYVKLAHSYINTIKSILYMYAISMPSVDKVLSEGKLTKEITSKLPPSDIKLCKNSIQRLKKLSKNSEVSYENLVNRSEFIPSDVSYEDEYVSQEQVFEHETRAMHLAILVSKIKDQMTARELEVAEGVMLGKTYEEIGSEQNPKRTAAWVKQQLNNVKKRIKGE
jgi:RNA polymerase sigma factor (sigma-70 family)